MTKQYSKKFYKNRQKLTKTSAEMILSLLFSRIQFNSVIDFGCATGIWIAACKKYGANNCLGLDGDWIDKKQLEISDDEFIVHNLNLLGYVPKSRYDLAICIEVAEHLTQEMGDVLVKSLTESSDVILFSAAVCGQGGTGHINEQPQHYWSNKFALQNYICIDLIRPKIWNDEFVNIIYKQNMLLYVHDEALKKLDFETDVILAEYEIDRIHPDLLSLKVPKNQGNLANIIKGLKLLAKGFGFKG